MWTLLFVMRFSVIVVSFVWINRYAVALVIGLCVAS